jgi:hypothetical protein
MPARTRSVAPAVAGERGMCYYVVVQVGEGQWRVARRLVTEGWFVLIGPTFDSSEAAHAACDRLNAQPR